MSVILNCGCGAKFEAKRKSRYPRCPACAIRARQLRCERYREKQKVVAVSVEKALERGVRMLTVVNDPLDIGGFQPGTVFDKEDWKNMIIHLTFTPETILKDGSGRLYVFRLGGALQNKVMRIRGARCK